MVLDHVLALPRRFAAAPAGSLVDFTRAAADEFSSLLAGAGFSEGSRRRHPGQGTSNRRLFLDDLMIECLLVEDEAELDHPRGAVLGLTRRFRDPDASSLGFGFRPDDAAGASAPGFASIAYRPGYLPPAPWIDVATGIGVRAPLLFHLPFAARPPGVPDDAEPRAHANGARSTSGVHVDSPALAAGHVRRALGAERVSEGIECLHVRLEGVAPDFELDLRPRFALRLHA